jgi:hypothetical protein
MCFYPFTLQNYNISPTPPNISAFFRTKVIISPLQPTKQRPRIYVLTQMPSADAQALQVARVKTDTLDRGEINSVNGSKNI